MCFPPDLGDLESVFREYDAVLQVKAVKENVKGLLDASSLLWRLEMSGVAVGEKRWETVTEGMKHHIQNHRSPWCIHVFTTASLFIYMQNVCNYVLQIYDMHNCVHAGSVLTLCSA